MTVKKPTGLLVTVSNYILFLIQSLSSSSRVIPQIYGCGGIKFMLLIYEYAIYEDLKICCDVLGQGFLAISLLGFSKFVWNDCPD